MQFIHWLTSNKLVNVRYMYVINKMSIPVFQTKYTYVGVLKTFKYSY